jgi:hypothetical protein
MSISNVYYYDTIKSIKNIKDLIKVDSTVCYSEGNTLWVILNIIKDYNHDGTYDYINIGIKYIENKENNFIHVTSFVDNIDYSIAINRKIIILDHISLLNLLQKFILFLSGSDYFYLRPSEDIRLYVKIKEVLKMKIQELLDCEKYNNVVNFKNDEIFIYDIETSRYFIPLFGYKDTEFVLFLDCSIDIENEIIIDKSNFRFISLNQLKNKTTIKINRFFLMKILKKIKNNYVYFDNRHFSRFSVERFLILKMNNIMQELSTELRKKHSAIKIQTIWRDRITNPDYKICKDRLLNEFMSISNK